MVDNKKYKIIKTIEDDAPFGNINWCTISFLTPQNIDNLKYIDVKGFKIHNGYNTSELASDDAKKIKEHDKNHDVYLSQIGKIYSWDDATKTDCIEYDDEKLNNLEKTRRENIDKIKLMSEQFKNERKTIYATASANTDAEKAELTRKRLQEKLYADGKITLKELEMIRETNKPCKDVKQMAESLEKIKTEMEECFQTDYLAENNPVPLKFGCISIYSPKKIGGLKTLCFKIRGLFQSMPELDKRIKKLESIYPHDRLYRFEIGKWTPFSENDDIHPLNLLKQLNYSMKHYLENLTNEESEFEKRKENLQSQTEQESKIIKANNRREKRNGKRSNAKSKVSVPVSKPAEIESFGDQQNKESIQNILDYLDDPELRNKYPASSTTTTEVTL